MFIQTNTINLTFCCTKPNMVHFRGIWPWTIPVETNDAPKAIADNRGTSRMRRGAYYPTNGRNPTNGVTVKKVVVL